MIEFVQGKKIQGRKDHHAVAGLIKQWLRNLPEPILTWEVCSHFKDMMDKGKCSISLKFQWFLHRINRSYAVAEATCFNASSSQQVCTATPSTAILSSGTTFWYKQNGGKCWIQLFQVTFFKASNLAIVLTPVLYREAPDAELDASDFRKFFPSIATEIQKIRCWLLLVIQSLIENYDEIFSVALSIHKFS